jgi:hypothetical protein
MQREKTKSQQKIATKKIRNEEKLSNEVTNQLNWRDCATEQETTVLQFFQSHRQ